MSQSLGKPPFIIKVNHDREIPKDTLFTISLDGEWPTPSWTHENTSIDLNNDENIATISYLGTRRPGVAMQVIKSFTVDFDLKLPTKAKWKIIVKGRSEDWESVINVV